MLNFLIIGGYLVASVVIGLTAGRKNTNTESYLLGGRSMPFLAVGLSAMMTLLSSVSLVNMPGEVYNNGITLFFLGLIVMPVMQIVAYLLFVRFYFKLGSFTPYEYLELRYNSSIRALVAVCAFYTRTLYLGMVLYATSKIFHAAYGWHPFITILIAGGVGLIYTAIGGMKAVIWTDVMQFFVFFIGITLVGYHLFGNIDGGVWGAVKTGFEAGHGIPQFTQKSFYTINPYVRLLFFLLLWDMIMAPVEAASSDQIHLQRLLSTRTWQEGFKSQIVCTCISWCARVTLILLGLGLFTYYKQNPDPALLKLGGDGALFRFISTKLPGPVSALFVAAMLAAIMSTLSSGLNSMATIYLKEIHGKFINKKMDDKKELQVSKYATLWIGIVTMGLGLLIHSSGQWFSQSMAEVGAIFGILGAATIPAFLFAVLSSRASTKLIWGYAFFAFGEVISKNIWYALSTTSFLAWKADPSAGFGWAGKQEPTYLLLTVAFMAVSGFPYLIKSLRSRRIVQIMAFGSITAAGLALGLLEWYFFSNFYIVDQPMARSFAFHFPFGFIGAFIILWFCPVQPEKKYKGLTVSTLGHPIAALEDKQ